MIFRTLHDVGILIVGCSVRAAKGKSIMREVAKTTPLIEGKDVRQKRILPNKKLRHLDPFIRVDHFYILGGGYANQVHHGFEGLLYVFSGSLHHEDSLGNYFNLEAGSGELFNAGQGLVHAEITEKKVHGMRIWIDLPPDLKHMKPEYTGFSAKEIPVEKNANIIKRTIVGPGSPVRPQTKMSVLDVVIGKKSVFKYDIPAGYNGFLYVIVGQVKVNGQEISASETFYFKDDIETKALAILTHQGGRVLICFGEPHGGDINVQESHTE